MTDKTQLDEAASLNISAQNGDMNSTTTFVADDVAALATLLKNAGVAGNSAVFNGPATLTIDAEENGGTMSTVIQAPDLRTIMNLLEPEFAATADLDMELDGPDMGDQEAEDVIATDGAVGVVANPENYSVSDGEYDVDLGDPLEDDLEEEADYDYRDNEAGTEEYQGVSDRKPVQAKTKDVPARSGDNPVRSLKDYMEEARKKRGNNPTFGRGVYGMGYGYGRDDHEEDNGADTSAELGFDMGGDFGESSAESLSKEFNLNELSSDTLSSYVDKARASKAHHEKKASDLEDLGHDADRASKMGIMRAGAGDRVRKWQAPHDATARRREIGLDRLGAVEEENINELSVDAINRYVARAGDERPEGKALAMKKKWGNKDFGFEEPRVKAKWGHEVDEETVNEISNDTKNRYFKKAADDINTHAQHSSNMRGIGNHDQADKHDARVFKRAKGMNAAIAKESEGDLDEASRATFQDKARQFGTPYYLNTDCGYASLDDLGTHDYFDHSGVVVLSINRNGKWGLNYVAGQDSTPPGTKVTCVTQTSSGQKYREGKVVDSFTMDEYNNDREGLAKRLATHGITPTRKLSVKTFD